MPENKASCAAPSIFTDQVAELVAIGAATEESLANANSCYVG